MVSILYSSIKSGGQAPRGAEADKFQFYIVRLKAICAVTGYGLVSWFQFYIVRLKVTDQMITLLSNAFQFYIVRLKVLSLVRIV